MTIQRDAAVLPHHAEQFLLQNELTLLVLLTVLEGLVVFPPDRFLALSAGDISYNVPPRCHAAFGRFCQRDIDHVLKQIGFPMLSAEILCHVG